MKSFTTADFWKAYAELSPDMKEQARKAYQLWQENPLHPSLHFKKVGRNLWSARVSSEYWALAGNVCGG
jgi:IS1 family transposase